jgi:hypothetical protein
VRQAFATAAYVSAGVAAYNFQLAYPNQTTLCGVEVTTAGRSTTTSRTASRGMQSSDPTDVDGGVDGGGGGELDVEERTALSLLALDRENWASDAQVSLQQNMRREEIFGTSDESVLMHNLETMWGNSNNGDAASPISSREVGDFSGISGASGVHKHGHHMGVLAFQGRQQVQTFFSIRSVIEGRSVFKILCAFLLVLLFYLIPPHFVLCTQLVWQLLMD